MGRAGLTVVVAQRRPYAVHVLLAGGVVELSRATLGSLTLPPVLLTPPGSSPWPPGATP